MDTSHKPHPFPPPQNPYPNPNPTPTEAHWPQSKRGQFFLEGYVRGGGGGGGEEEEAAAAETEAQPPMARTKCLTGDDLDELKGCFDLVFGFSYDGIPELSSTLPALELCYSINQRFLDERRRTPSPTDLCSPPPLPLPSASFPDWKISSPVYR